MTRTLGLLLAVLLIMPSVCFGLWEVAIVDKAKAKELGMDIRYKEAGPNHVRVEMTFKVEGELKQFDRVEVALGEGDNPPFSATLRDTRPKPGVVHVEFLAARDQVTKVILSVWVDHSERTRTVYSVPMKEFVSIKNAP